MLIGLDPLQSGNDPLAAARDRLGGRICLWGGVNGAVTVEQGAPGEVTIGVWSVGSELRLFLNGRYQFGFTDTSFSSGGLGLFAFSEGTDPVSVTFSDLKVYEVDYVLPTKTPKP